MPDNLPRLFERAAFNVNMLHRGGVAAEALQDAGFFDGVEAVLAAFETATQRGSTIRADPDLSDAGRVKRLRELTEPAKARAEEALTKALGTIRTAHESARRRLEEIAAAPDPERTSTGAILHALRCADLRQQLAALDPSQRPGAVLAAAHRGDLGPAQAAEASLLPLVDPEVLARARVAFAEAKDAPLARRVEQTEKQIQIAEQVAAIARAVLDQTTRSLERGLPIPDSTPSLDERIAAAVAERTDAAA